MYINTPMSRVSYPSNENPENFFDRDARRSGPTIYFVVLQGLIKNLLEISVNLNLAFERTHRGQMRSLRDT